MIGGDQRGAVRRAYPLRDPAETRINVLARLDRLIQINSMSHHVGVREVDHENIRVTLVDPAQHFVSDLERRHLGCEIVSRDLG